MRFIFLLIAFSFTLPAQQPAQGAADASIRRAFARLYNFDFTGAHEILDAQIRQDPKDPLPKSVKAAAYLFAELSRLKILELDFFADDDKVVDRRKLIPDADIHQKFFQTVDDVERLSNARLASKADDPDALFSLCIVTGLVADYAALIEKRRFGSLTLAKKSHIWAHKLLALNPPVYDAYMTFGTAEYVVGSMPFFVRWFVHFDQVEGNKQKGIDELEMVAQRGRYYGPFARMLLAVVAFREKRPADAEKLLASLASEYPDNPLIRKELARASRLVHPGIGSSR